MSGARIQRALSVLLRPLQFLLYGLSGFVPRRRGQWALGSWSGHRFGDNGGAVYDHLQAHPHAGVTTAWITHDASIARAVRARGGRAFTAWSPRGIWWTVRAEVFVYDSLPKDVNFWLSRGAKLVHLRHGIGIKKIERAIDTPGHRLHQLFHGRLPRRLVWQILLPWHVPVPDLVFACSPTHASQAPWFFGVEPEQMRITGFPRHDRLAEAPPQDRTAVPTQGRAVPGERPLFVYLPTFREAVTTQTFDWDGLEAAAAAADVTVAVKLHYVDVERGVQGADRLLTAEHLRMVDPASDPTDAYLHADGMISDFSSAPFDFMLLERPIVYWAPDLEEFAARRPLMYSLEEVAAGPICRTVEELTEAIAAAREGALGANDDRFERLREEFHTYPPGGASQRVVEAVVEAFWGEVPEGQPRGRFDYVVDGHRRPTTGRDFTTPEGRREPT